MILETAVLHLKPELQHTFETSFKEASQYIASIKGYINHELHRCIESEKSIPVIGSLGNAGGAHDRFQAIRSLSEMGTVAASIL